MMVRWLCLLLLALPACKREAPATPEASAPAEEGDATTPAAAALPGLCLWVIETSPQGPRGEALQKALLERLPGSGPFLGMGGPAGAGKTSCPPTLSPLARAGLSVAVALDPVDDAGEPTTLERGTQLLLRARAHVERGDDQGRPQIAEANLEIPVPLPPEADAAAIDKLWSWRAVTAATLAAEDAAGQLVLRTFDDAAVRAALDDDAIWRRIGALREIGERGLGSERQAVEALARGSRPDLAAVAAATLGRLGDGKSVPALRQALAHSSVEVADAALVALSDLADPSARAALQEAAREHPHPWIRQRALVLLRSGPGAAAGAAERQGRTP